MDMGYLITVSEAQVDIITVSAPKPLTCPVCSNPYWLVWGMKDFIKISERCTCKNQMAKSDKK